MFRILRWLIYFFLLIGGAGGGFAIARLQRIGVNSVPNVPSVVQAKPGRMTVIQVDSPTPVRWHRCSSAHEPDVLVLDDGKTVIFVANQPGKYELIAWSAVGNVPTDAARCAIVVDGPTPTPPDGLVEQLRAAWNKETSSSRSQHRDALVRIYRQAADELVRQTTLTTLNDLYLAIRRNAQTALPSDALVTLRTTIGEVLQQRLPTVDGPLTEELRKRCGEAFRAVAAALEQLDTPSHSFSNRCVNCR